MKENILEYKNVDVCYNYQRAVSDISFSLKKGEILGIVGESGSGKSTLIKAAMRLLGNQGKVTKGDILYHNESLLKLDKEKFRQLCGNNIAMIFQDCEASLNPVYTIEESLCQFVLEHVSLSKDEIKKKALKILEIMNIENGERLLKSYPFELSGGMNQRVGIMMAMILKPDLLFCDEPTSALDVLVQKQVIDEMLKMKDLYQSAFVIVSHNIGLIKRMADKVVVIHEGKIVEYGKMEDVIDHPQHDYTKKLLNSVIYLNKGN